MKESLGFTEGMIVGMSKRGVTNKGKVFDWDKAAEIIREAFKHNSELEAQAGLREDWDWTGGTIFEYGQPTDNSSTYLASGWATPTLYLYDGIGGEEEHDCWVYRDEDTRFNSGSKWDEQSLKILNNEDMIHI